jgi:rSAM/selenodomain-associated transferase 1
MAGFAKTRLIPALGAEQAARLARRMLLQTLGEAQAASVGPIELCVTPGPSDGAWKDWPRLDGIVWSEQAAGDLGARMAQVAERATRGGEHVLLIGTDCPELDAARLQQAAQLLRQTDAVLYPTSDGGYALLGLRRFDPRPFERMSWSTAEVTPRTIERLGELGWSLTIGDTLHDIDEPGDLQWLPEDWRFEPRPTQVAATGSRQ